MEQEKDKQPCCEGNAPCCGQPKGLNTTRIIFLVVVIAAIVVAVIALMKK